MVKKLVMVMTLYWVATYCELGPGSESDHSSWMASFGANLLLLACAVRDYNTLCANPCSISTLVRTSLWNLFCTRTITFVWYTEVLSYWPTSGLRIFRSSWHIQPDIPRPEWSYDSLVPRPEWALTLELVCEMCYFSWYFCLPQYM